MKIINFSIFFVILFVFASLCVCFLTALDYFTGTKDLVVVLPLSALTALTLLLVFTFRRTKIKQLPLAATDTPPGFTKLGRDFISSVARKRNSAVSNTQNAADDDVSDTEMLNENSMNSSDAPFEEGLPQGSNRADRIPNTRVRRHSISMSVIRRKSNSVNSKF